MLAVLFDLSSRPFYTITLILEYFDQPLIPDNLTNKPVVPDLGGAGVN